MTTDFILDEQAALPRVLAAIRSDGLEELYAYGPEGLHAQRTITGTTDILSYALLDAQGSLKHLTDSTGMLTLTRVYDAWGVLRFTSGSGGSRLGYTSELQDGNLVYLRARWYHTGLGTFTSRDTYAGTPERPQSLHRYGYGENRPTMLSDPSGYSVDEYGHWTPCNMLPGREDSCSAQDDVDWWGSDSGDTFRRFSVTVVTDVGAALASIPDIPYQILTNPQGVIWGILYGPIGFVENAAGGFICGDPEKLAHVTSGYGMFVVGGVLKSIEKTPAPSAPPWEETPPRPAPKPSHPPILDTTSKIYNLKGTYTNAHVPHAIKLGRNFTLNNSVPGLNYIEWEDSGFSSVQAMAMGWDAQLVEALDNATHIHFNIDTIEPKSLRWRQQEYAKVPNRITYDELDSVITNKAYLEKTTFYNEGIKLPPSEVADFILHWRELRSLK